MITASLSLADVPGTVRLWRQRKVEFFLSVVAFLGVALLGVLPGIAIAVALSILNVFRRAWLPYETVLGKVDGLEGSHDIHSYPDARHLPGLVIYRFDAPLFFANAKTLRDEIRHLSRSEPKPKWIVVAAEPITDVDTTASDVLFELDHELDQQGMSLVFAELKDPVRRKIDRYGLARAIEPRPLLPHGGGSGHRLPEQDRDELDFRDGEPPFALQQAADDRIRVRSVSPVDDSAALGTFGRLSIGSFEHGDDECGRQLWSEDQQREPLGDGGGPIAAQPDQVGAGGHDDSVESHCLCLLHGTGHPGAVVVAVNGTGPVCAAATMAASRVNHHARDLRYAPGARSSRVG